MKNNIRMFITQEGKEESGHKALDPVALDVLREELL